MVSSVKVRKTTTPKIDVERPYFAKHLLTKDVEKFSPVFALSIFNIDSTDNGVITPDTLILAGVRRPETNLSDPNVISVPTHRIPAAFLQDIVNELEPKSIEEKVLGPDKRVYATWKEKHSNGPSKAKEMVTFLVKSLMSSKLGTAEALYGAEGKLKLISVEPRVSIFGQVVGTNANPVDGVEMIHMLGIAAFVRFDRNPFLKQTESYANIQFIKAKDFVQIVEKKDPMLISMFGDWAEVCVRGLCVLTANAQIHNDLKEVC